MDRQQIDRWTFVLMLSLLGSVFTWQLTKDRVSTPHATLNETMPHRKIRVVPAANSLYSKEEMLYFQDIAFGSEHKLITAQVRKWTKNINIRVEGQPTEEDLLTLETTIGLLNSLQGQVELSIGYFDTSLVVNFAPKSAFHELHSQYKRSDPGFFWVSWIDDVIYRGTILIDSTSEQSIRNSLLREELTQSLGLMNMSDSYADSIFNDSNIRPDQELSDMDRLMVTILYRDDILPGMTEYEAMALISQITTSKEKRP